MKKYPALVSAIVTASAIILFLPKNALSQENPAGQKAFNPGPVGFYSLTATSGPKPGQVTLSWKQSKADVQNYHILYGTSPNNFQFSAINIDGGLGVGKTVSYTVNFLTPGAKYYFALSPVSGGKALPLTFQVSETAKPGVAQIAPTSVGALTGPAPTASLTGPVAGDTPAGQKVIKASGAGAHQLSAKVGDKPGEVILTWKKAFADVDGYSVVYGTEPGKFQYGAQNIGNTTSYKIGGLKPGQKYYFALVPAKGGAAQYISAQVTEVAKPGVVAPSVVPTVAPPAAASTAPALTGPVVPDSINSQTKSGIKSSDVGLHHLSVKKGAKASEVILEWKQAYKDVDNYDIVYGTEPGKLQYGAQNIGKTGKFAVKGLDPNKQYYFALVPKKGGQAQYITGQASTAGAEAAKAEEIKQSAGAPSTAAPRASGGTGAGGAAGGGPSGGSSGGGFFGIPGLSVPGQSGQSAQPAGGGGQKSESSKGESKPQESKKESEKPKKSKKKSKVEGASTVRSIINWIFAPLSH